MHGGNLVSFQYSAHIYLMRGFIIKYRSHFAINIAYLGNEVFVKLLTTFHEHYVSFERIKLLDIINDVVTFFYGLLI